MQAKRAMLGAAFIAALSTAKYSAGALAVMCSAADIEPARSCTMNEGIISVIVESHPITTIYNLVDNSLNFSGKSNTDSAAISTIIESSPTTTIYNLVSNAINLQISETRGVPIEILVESKPVTTIYNIIDNSISLLEANSGLDTIVNSLIESTPLTTIYNLVDNAVGIAVTNPNGQDNLGSSVVATAPEPGSLTLLGAALGALSLVCMGLRTRCSRDRIWAALSRLRSPRGSFTSGLVA
jgi:hypothetical protein